MTDRASLRTVFEGTDFDAARDALSGFLRDEDGASARNFAANRIKGFGGAEQLTPARIALVTSFTGRPIEPYLTVTEFFAGRRLEPVFIEYGQWYSAIATPDMMDESALDAVFVLLHLEDVAPAFAYSHLHEPDASRSLETVMAGLADAIAAFRERSSLPIVLATFTALRTGAERYFDRKHPLSKQAAIDGLNQRLSEIAGTHRNVHILDYANLVADTGRAVWFDPVKAHLNGAAISHTGLNALSGAISTVCSALTRPRKKVLVCDLDNTLWGGIVGEDGPDGIAVSGAYPGNAYADFQRFLKNLSATGVALAIASKNNWEDAIAGFEKNPSMPLKFDDFSAARINWQDKPQNIAEIAKELNVGTDSLVFIDDNPMECELVRRTLPEVTVVHLEGAPSTFADAVLATGCFDTLSVTEEDTKKVEMFKAEKKRSALANGADKSEFLASLNLEMEFRPPHGQEIQRVAQLINKTNQFNLTTRRYTEAEVDDLLKQRDADVRVVKLRDCFGDYGLIGVIISKDKSDTEREIDTLLMSCRVLGRGVESAILANIEKEAREDGKAALIGRFVPSQKNQQVADLYPKFGFENGGEDGVFIRPLSETDPAASPSYIRVINGVQNG